MSYTRTTYSTAKSLSFTHYITTESVFLSKSISLLLTAVKVTVVFLRNPNRHSLSQCSLWVREVDGSFRSQQFLKVKVSQLVLEVLKLLTEVDRWQLLSTGLTLHRLLHNTMKMTLVAWSCMGGFFFQLLLLVRMCLWWSLCTSYLLACQVRATTGNSGPCCGVCVTSFKH